MHSFYFDESGTSTNLLSGPRHFGHYMFLLRETEAIEESGILDLKKWSQPQETLFGFSEVNEN